MTRPAASPDPITVSHNEAEGHWKAKKARAKGRRTPKTPAIAIVQIKTMRHGTSGRAVIDKSHNPAIRTVIAAAVEPSTVPLPTEE